MNSSISHSTTQYFTLTSHNLKFSQFNKFPLNFFEFYSTKQLQSKSKFLTFKNYITFLETTNYSIPIQISIYQKTSTLYYYRISYHNSLPSIYFKTNNLKSLLQSIKKQFPNSTFTDIQNFKAFSIRTKNHPYTTFIIYYHKIFKSYETLFSIEQLELIIENLTNQITNIEINNLINPSQISTSKNSIETQNWENYFNNHTPTKNPIDFNKFDPQNPFDLNEPEEI
jgi:hypothetical protein